MFAEPAAPVVPAGVTTFSTEMSTLRLVHAVASSDGVTAETALFLLFTLSFFLFLMDKEKTGVMPSRRQFLYAFQALTSDGLAVTPRHSVISHAEADQTARAVPRRPGDLDPVDFF